MNNKIELRKDCVSAIRYVEHIKDILYSNDVMPQVIFGNNQYEFEVYCEVLSKDGMDIAKEDIKRKFKNPFATDLYDISACSSVGIGNDMELLWDGGTNWKDIV